MTSESSRGASAAGDGSPDDSDYNATSYAATSHDGSGSIPVREEYVEPQRTQVQEHTVVRRQARPTDADNAPVNVAVGAERQDGVRWGPIWAGLLTALTTFILLELLFYALGWLTLDPGPNDPGTTRWLMTGILALVAFFLGGLVAGATTIWKGLFSGLLHGFMVWALGVAAFIALTFFGGSALLGSFGNLTHQLGVGPQEVQDTTHISKSEADDLAASAKDAAGPAFWGLFLPLASAMAGGLIGSKIWPRRDDSDPDTIRLRS